MVFSTADLEILASIAKAILQQDRMDIYIEKTYIKSDKFKSISKGFNYYLKNLLKKAEKIL